MGMPLMMIPSRTARSRATLTGKQILFAPLPVKSSTRRLPLHLLFLNKPMAATIISLIAVRDAVS